MNSRQRVQLLCLFLFSLIALLILLPIFTSTRIAHSGEVRDSDHSNVGNTAPYIVPDYRNATDLTNVYLPLLASPEQPDWNVEFLGQIGGGTNAIAISGNHAYV
jgi:hypothetical protein